MSEMTMDKCDGCGQVVEIRPTGWIRFDTAGGGSVTLCVVRTDGESGDVFDGRRPLDFCSAECMTMRLDTIREHRLERSAQF